jgi:hypothetical protein
MAFGPDDIGHWRDKLPYVRHDLELIREREDVLEKFGRFDYGFDFGAPVDLADDLTRYRAIPFSLRNSVEARFQPISPKSANWTTPGPRHAVGIPLAPYLEVRAVARDPQHLPEDVLFRDYIRGSGPQRFQLKAPAGDYEVLFLHPDGRADAAKAHSDGALTITFPEGEWKVSGLVIKGAHAKEPLPAWTEPQPVARPSLIHQPPRQLQPGQPLTLHLMPSSTEHITSVRLHYRSVNQLARFKTLEAKPSNISFTIPAEDISAQWDLMYYFEVLNDQKTGWFKPDPSVETPYYVIKVGD